MTKIFFDIEAYDLETEQRLEDLKNSLPWDNWEQSLESSAIAGSFELVRMVDKQIIQDLLKYATSELGKRLRYKHNKKRKFKKWNNQKISYIQSSSPII